jgi:Skp family chaperone for outer membrane proteins
MKIRSAAIAAAIASLTSAQAFAQATTAETGPVIAGVCLFSQDSLIADSQVGQYIVQRVQTIAQQVNAELNQQGQQIEAERANLEAQIGPNGENAASYTPQLQAFQQRTQQFVALRDLRAEEVQRTSDQALSTVFQAAGPLVEQIYASRNCSILLDSDLIIRGNPAMDITPSVVQQLNATLTQFDVQKVNLQAVPAGGGAVPAAPTGPITLPPQ